MRINEVRSYSLILVIFLNYKNPDCLYIFSLNFIYKCVANTPIDYLFITNFGQLILFIIVNYKVSLTTKSMSILEGVKAVSQKFSNNKFIIKSKPSVK
jgi:hypothetical protein